MDSNLFFSWTVLVSALKRYSRCFSESIERSSRLFRSPVSVRAVSQSLYLARFFAASSRFFLFDSYFPVLNLPIFSAKSIFWDVSLAELTLRRRDVCLFISEQRSICCFLCLNATRNRFYRFFSVIWGCFPSSGERNNFHLLSFSAETGSQILYWIPLVFGLSFYCATHRTGCNLARHASISLALPSPPLQFDTYLIFFTLFSLISKAQVLRIGLIDVTTDDGLWHRNTNNNMDNYPSLYSSS